MSWVEVSSDLQAINNIIMSRHPVVSNPHMLLIFITFESKFFALTDLCNAFFSISADEASQYLFLSLGKERIQLYSNGSGFTESSYFSQILKADVDDIKFLRGLYFVTIYG